jgi:hypothetical protein
MTDLRINAFDTNAPIGNVTQHPVSDSLLSIGFVVASPSSGLVKAILPNLGLYSDIRIEDLNPIFSDPAVIIAENPKEPLDMDREELKAHLEAQDSRVDLRLMSFEQTIKDAMGEIRLNSAESMGELKAMHVELGHLKNIKGSIWGAAGATIVGVGGILAAILSYGNSSYDTARDNTTVIAEAKAQIVNSGQKVEDSLKAMAAQLEDAKRQTAETQRLLEQVKVQQSSKSSSETVQKKR